MCGSYVSQDAYRFLRLVKQQSKLVVSVFDHLPQILVEIGKISLEWSEEVVLGYFIAAGEKSKTCFIFKIASLTFWFSRAIILMIL